MPVASSTHPTDSVLTEFVLGKLPDPESEEVERHLSDCPQCLSRAVGVRPSDTLASLIAAVGTRVDSQWATDPASAATPIEHSPTLEWGARAASTSVVADVPESLARHDRYRLVRPLGEGGMGVVWQAEHILMGRTVALKVIHPAILSRPGAVERFRREVRAAAQVNHPNIVTAHDADEADGTQILVMEYVAGETLLEVVRRGRLPLVEACRAIRDAARGLAHAHAIGLVHRDIKPGNLIRAADGTVKVLDFGLVGISAGGDGLTGENVVMGTPDYIAPEQANDAAAADSRSDVYALGCTLYHLIAGRVPYRESSTLRKLDSHRDPTISPAPIPGVPAPLARVLTRMTATNPADRYQTADAVADALAPFSERAEMPAEPDARRFRLASRWRIVIGTVAFAALLAVAATVFTIRRGDEIVTVETDDPDIEVVMRKNGELVRIVDTKTKQVWELDTRKLRLTPDGSGLSVDLPGGDPLILSRNGDAVVTIRRVPPAAAAPTVVDTLRPYRVFSGHLKQTRMVAFSLDGKTVYSTGDDGYVRVWEVESGRETAAFDHRVRVLAVAVAEGGRTLLSVTSPEGAGPSRLWAWDLAAGKEGAAFPPVPPGERLSTVVVAPGGALAATFALDGTVRVWDVPGRKQLRTWKVPVRVALYALAWSADGRLMAASSHDGLTLSDVTNGRPVHHITGEPDEPTWIGFSADDTQVYAVGWLGGVRVYDRTSGKLVRRLSTSEARGQASTYGAVLPDGRLLLTANSADVRVWDPRADRLVARLTDAGLDSTFPAVSADGRWAAAGSVDGKVRVWKLPAVPKP